MRRALLCALVMVTFACSESDDGSTIGGQLRDTSGVFQGEDGQLPDGGGEDAATQPDNGGTEETTLGGDAKLTLLPQTVNFGTAQPGLGKTATFIMRNDGGVPIDVQGIAIDPADQGFAITSDPTGVIGPGFEREVSVELKSELLGSRNATAFITTDPVVDSDEVTLKGIVSVGPATVITELTSSAASLKFGAVLVGTSKSVTFHLVNSGNTPLQIVSMAMDPAFDPDFTFVADKQAPLILLAGEQIEITATYTPDAVESDAGVLRVENGSFNKPVLEVPMTGSGYTGPCAGKLVCGPSPMTFGTVAMGQQKAVTLVCSNQGLGPVVVTSAQVALSGADGFSWTTPTLPVTLNGGEGVAVPVIFTPADEVEKGGTITIESDDCDDPVKVVPVTAQGKPAPQLPPCLEPGVFEPQVEWEWVAGEPYGNFDMVFMAPIVISLDDDDGDGDIDGEDVPEVVFVAHSGGFPAGFNDDKPGVLRAIHGDDASPMWAVGGDDDIQPGWASNLAAAELDGLPGPEIVAIAYTPSPPGVNCPGVPDIIGLGVCGKYAKGHLIAYHGADGSVFWKSEPWNGAVSDLENMGAPTIADLDGDGVAEVILGNHVFNGLNGQLLWAGTAGRGNDGHGYISLVADVDGDGSLDVLAGNTAYDASGAKLWQAAQGDTHGTAIADLDQNGSMEVFINGPGGQSIIADGATGATLHGPVSSGISGCCVAAPAVADVDLSKPGLEIVTVGDSFLRVYDRTLTLLWEKQVADETGAAGPAVFDVEGDGVAEVVYADEQDVYVLRGSDGAEIFHGTRSSATGLDNPIIADVDGDGHAEILVSREAKGQAGLRLFSNADDSWVATRRIWNQHAYSVVNIYDNGTVPPGTVAADLGAMLLRSNLPTCE